MYESDDTHIGDPDRSDSHDTSTNPFMGDDGAIGHVAIKPVAFSRENVAFWFMNLEAQFTLARVISDQTRYFHALAALPIEVTANIPMSELATQSYKALKEALVKDLEVSATERLQELLEKTPLLGRPSQWVRELSRKVQNLGVGEDLLRHKFLQALPPSVRMVLVGQKTLTLEQMASLADDMLAHADNVVAAVQPQQFQQQSQRPQRNYQQQRCHQQQERSSQPNATRPFSVNQRPKVCRAHLWFGRDARTCRRWCQWPNKTGLNITADTRPNSRTSSPTRVHPNESSN